MRKWPITWLTALVALVFTLLLATPVVAAAAHSHVIGAVVEAVESHGHAHGDVGADIHDATDHAHDVPHHPSVQSPWSIFRPIGPAAWS
ncbi:hypothetical protein [Devosia sp. Naph2]|uniref:hypothetical protein n=1 Tax=Devosia polycyclovorans TaxID=3345148 RepID=UPI0035D0B324